MEEQIFLKIFSIYRYFLNDEKRPWQLVLDNHATQVFPGEYTGFFALDDKNFYTLTPITELQGKNGAQKILGGSIGYEIFNSNGKSVAAVSLIDNGEVYFHRQDPSERLLLPSLCAALLLQEDISGSGI